MKAKLYDQIKTLVEIQDDFNDYQIAFGGKKIIRMLGSEKLPVLARLLDNPNYIDINNFYQRRLSWDKQAQSRLIESFLYNFPVPSITLYEKGHNSYIVVDGKQRILAIKDFYDNKLELTGLELNPELKDLHIIKYLKTLRKILIGAQ